ncbi:MAG: DNA helicase RecQ [Cytophagales bacterium]|nr:DNA helicase RecQ [Cytophagales bacterium]MDW8383331.1 DNA helicase RecQ [Flammeovirgaceae bacterium]
MEVDSSANLMEKAREKLKEVFGYVSFRGNQEAIIHNILQGRNTFVIMPTGAGKSLCYQLPAIVLEGTAIVISPLIALMKNQVDQMNAFGVNAQFLNSTLSKAEITKVKKETLAGAVKLLYVAPESLAKEENIEFLRKAKISFIAVDEAHCISEWGHDFRPEYRRIKTIIDHLGNNLPIIALTATATPKVRQDIQKNLRMENADLFLSSFLRSNLYYEVKPKIDSKKQLVRFIKQHKGKSGIVYCLSRKKVEEIAEFLKVNDIRALPYHAGMDSAQRMANQDAFLNEDCDVIVATIAFGMGIDKPDVRFVVHYDAPKSIEGYYQETGRAGRDGLDSHCLMFFSPKDIDKLEKFQKDKSVTERDNAKILLEEMTYYANSSVCRARQLLHYFGEYMPHDCGNCDNCLRKEEGKAEEFDATEMLLTVLNTVVKTGQRFGIRHIVDVITGNTSDNKYIESYGHDKLPEFATGKEESPSLWETVVRQALIYGFLAKDTDDVTVIKITDKGKDFIENTFNIKFVKDHDYNSAEIEEDSELLHSMHTPQASAADEVLLEMLRSLCKKIAKQKKLPPYVIFQEASLEEMATTYPTTLEELARVNGVGQAKAQKFGQPFVEMIAKYVEENEIETANDVVVKTTVNKSKTKIFIIQQIDRKVDLDDIAEAKDITLSELIEEIEHICYSGTKLNIDYYINQILDPEKQQEIYEYFMNAENDSIKDAMEAFADDDITEEELRLMRIKFLSEVAL